MKKSVPTNRLFALLLSGLVAVGLASCASDKHERQEQQEEESYSSHSEEQSMDESYRQEQTEDEFSMDEFDMGSSDEMAGSHDRPWADQQVSLDDVEKVQEKLNEEGYNVGQVDGLIGPKTEEAIRNYQESNDLASTGELNQETIDSLGVDIELRQAQEAGDDTQMAE